MATTVLTATGLNSTTIPAGLSAWTKAQAIGSSGAGSGRQSSSIGGTGGGAGAYAEQTSINLAAGDVVYYNIATAGSAADTWFNDLNLALQTNNNIGGTSWTLDNSTVTQSQSDPLAGSVATKLLETAVNAQHGTYQAVVKPVSVAITMTLVVWLKAINGRGAVVAMTDAAGSNGALIGVDLTNGTISAAPFAFGTGFSAGTASIASAGSGWWRVVYSVPINDANAAANVVIRPTDDNLTNTSFLGDITKGLLIYGYNVTYGTKDKGFTPTTTKALYSVLAKGGTSGTTSAAGVHQTGSQGSTVNEGGDGFKPLTGNANGGGGGGAGGPNGAGSTATNNIGGAADGGTTAAPGANSNGTTGTQFDATHGSGAGASGRSGGTGNGFTGGTNGGGGSGSGTGAPNAGGAGSPGVIALVYTTATVTEPQLERGVRGAMRGMPGRLAA